MQKRRIALSGFAVGVAFALAWYLVLGVAAAFHLEDGPADVHWGSVTIAALISFLAGWGLVRLLGVLASEPQIEEYDPEQDDPEKENLNRCD
jgi:hypothetical protein